MQHKKVWPEYYKSVFIIRTCIYFCQDGYENNLAVQCAKDITCTHSITLEYTKQQHYIIINDIMKTYNIFTKFCVVIESKWQSV